MSATSKIRLLLISQIETEKIESLKPEEEIQALQLAIRKKREESSPRNGTVILGRLLGRMSWRAQAVGR